MSTTCIICGVTLPAGRRKYCSQRCHNKMHWDGASRVVVHINEIAQWQDRRAEARTKAKAATDAARAGAIAALAHRSRQDAKERGAARYIGGPCERHDNAERYTATGQCVLCNTEWTSARRGKPRSFGKVRDTIHTVRPRTSHRPGTRAAPMLTGATPVLLLDAED